ncbi:MAG: oligosaccharide flippase family protein [bacterium]
MNLSLPTYVNDDEELHRHRRRAWFSPNGMAPGYLTMTQGIEQNTPGKNLAVSAPRFLRESLIFSSSRYVLLGLSFIRNFVVARVLGPEEYGYWIVVSLIMTYGDQIHLGLRHAGDRQIPFLTGRKETAVAQQVANAIYAGVLILSFVGLVLMGLYVLFIGSENAVMKFALLTAALITVSDQVNRFYLMILRVTRNFVLSSKVESAFEILRTITVCLLVFLFQLSGLVTALMVASLATTVYFLRRFRKQYRPEINLSQVRSLLSIGTPLFISGLLYILLISLDRVVASMVLGKSDLGQYGLASLIAQLPLSGTIALTMMLYPRFSQEYGNSEDVSSMLPTFRKALLSTSYLMPIVVVGLFFSSEVLIRWLLPYYLPSIFVLQILAYGALLLVVIPLPLNTLMAFGKHRQYLQAQIAGIVLSSVAYALVVFLLPGLPGIAGAACFSYVVSLFLILFTVFKVFQVPIVELIREIGKNCIPVFWSILLLFALTHGIQTGEQISIVSSIGLALLKIVVFILIYSPMLIIVNRWTGVFSKLTALRSA